MDRIFKETDKEVVNKFEKSISEILSIYLIDSAKGHNLIDDRMRDYLINNL